MSVSEAEIEVAAKAIYEAEYDSESYPWLGRTDAEQASYHVMAKAALEAAARARWQPIEKCPKGDASYLLGCFSEHGHGMQFVAFWNDEAEHDTNRWQTADEIAYHNDLPTHFQLLPSPPESSK